MNISGSNVLFMRLYALFLYTLLCSECGKQLLCINDKFFVQMCFGLSNI